MLNNIIYKLNLQIKDRQESIKSSEPYYLKAFYTLFYRSISLKEFHVPILGRALPIYPLCICELNFLSIYHFEHVYSKIPIVLINFRYTVMSGTPSKMLEHLLETRLGGQVGQNDPFLDDFLLTHVIFMPVVALIEELNN